MKKEPEATCDVTQVEEDNNKGVGETSKKLEDKKAEAAEANKTSQPSANVIVTSEDPITSSSNFNEQGITISNFVFRKCS